MKIKILILLFVFLISINSIIALQITLLDDDLLSDTFVDKNNPNTNWESRTTVNSGIEGNAYVTRGLLMFNFTNMSTCGVINWADLILDDDTSTITADQSFRFVNATWGATTWNTQPCGTSEPVVSTDICSADVDFNETALVGGAGITKFNATSIVNKSFVQSRTNITMMLTAAVIIAGDPNNDFRYISKEGTGQSAILNISCSATSPPPPPDEQTFTITAKDIYDDSNINNLTITISNSSNKYTYSTQNGTILVSNKTNLQISKFNVTYDIKFSSSQAGGYLNNTHNINLTDGGSFIDKLYQAILYINASKVFSGSGIDEFWALSPLQINKSNSTGWTKLLLSAGSYNISANSTGYLDNKKSIDIAALSTNYENIVFGSANLSINAISIISGNSINDFSINITEISLNKKINKSTDDGSLILSAITGAYNVTIISDNFAYDSQTINILAADTLPNITFSLYTRNSINITIYDEETQKIINDTTTTLILNNLDSIMQTLYTSNGTIYKDDLFGGLWDIAVFNDFYNRRNYFVTIVDDTHTTLNVWLLNSSNGESKTFNIRNQEDEPLEDVFMTITNKVNDTFVVVAQKYSDISGQLSIFLKSTTEYRIMLEAAGYTTKIFNLEPASSLYNIILSTDVDIPFTTIYDKVSYSLTTTEGSLNFSIITSSTGGFISFFGLNSSFDGINYLTNVTGSVGGGTASIIILNSSNSTGRTIDIDYFIKLNGEDLINLHNTYYTYNATAISNYSALSVAEKYKGDFSGVMLAIISILVVVAIVATFAELGVPAAISGFAGAIILFVFSILGWLPILMTSSILIIVIGMFLFRRGD